MQSIYERYADTWGRFKPAASNRQTHEITGNHSRTAARLLAREAINKQSNREPARTLLISRLQNPCGGNQHLSPTGGADSVELALVHWIRQTMIGLEFCSVPSPHRNRLQGWIMQMPYGTFEGPRPTPPSDLSIIRDRHGLLELRIRTLAD